MWQWMSDRYGPMGYCTDDEKMYLERHPAYSALAGEGHWREVSKKEQESFNRYVGKLAYEQS
jgi:hypothetical protein